jgi:hypothetical protein
MTWVHGNCKVYFKCNDLLFSAATFMLRNQVTSANVKFNIKWNPIITIQAWSSETTTDRLISKGPFAEPVDLNTVMYGSLKCTATEIEVYFMGKKVGIVPNTHKDGIPDLNQIYGYNYNFKYLHIKFTGGMYTLKTKVAIMWSFFCILHQLLCNR